MRFEFCMKQSVESRLAEDWNRMTDVWRLFCQLTGGSVVEIGLVLNAVFPLPWKTDCGRESWKTVRGHKYETRGLVNRKELRA